MTDVKALLGELGTSDPKFGEAQAVVDLVRASGDMLERMREQHGWSQAELAERLGVTTARVSQLESGTLRNAPSLKMMARVAHACGESVQLTASGESAAQVRAGGEPTLYMADVMRELAALRGEVHYLRSALLDRELPEKAVAVEVRGEAGVPQALELPVGAKVRLGPGGDIIEVKAAGMTFEPRRGRRRQLPEEWEPASSPKAAKAEE